MCTTKKVKILIVTPSGDKIWQKPTGTQNRYTDRIWLIQGTGKYKISIMQNEYEKTYSYIKSVEVINNEILDKYLLPAKEIESDSPEIISLSKNITAGANEDIEKAMRIYDWVTTNIVYDLPKYVRMGKNDYSMNFGAMATLESKKGVCYDYSTLYAALARSSGVRVKVITGNYISNNSKLYHAWNEIYIKELDQWIPLDTSMAFINQESNFNSLDYVNKYEKTAEI
jgi:transglutaminase-like putative cysteine protease